MENKKLSYEKLQQILQNQVKAKSFVIKLNLWYHNIKEKKCEICNLSSWLGKEIPLELHHIDGDNQNNVVENLQILCPNCHSTTDNFRGKNIGHYAAQKATNEQLIEAIKNSYSRREALLKCGLAGYGGGYTRINKIILDNNLSFLQRELKPRPKASPKERSKTVETTRVKKERVYKTKIDWPDKETLQDLISKSPISAVSKTLGVSDSSVRNKAKQYNINLLEVSPWCKKHGDSSSKWRN